MTSRLFRSVTAVLLSFGLCAACSQVPDKAVTVEGTGTSASADRTASDAQDKPGGAGAELTQAQAQAALLTVPELPTGFAAMTSTTSATTSPAAQISPPECQELFDAFNTQDTQPASANATATFTHGGVLGTILSQSVSSYSEDNVGDAVGSIGQVLSTCPSFTSTIGSVTTTLTVSALSFPNLGDQTFAGRMTGVTQGITVSLDVVVVGIGHNMVSFAAGGLQPMNAAELEKVARDGVVKLGTVAK